MDDGTPINLTIFIDENKVPTVHFEWLFFFFYFFVASCFIFAKDRIGAERKTLCIDSIFSYLLDYSKNYLINSFKGDCT